jgi:hypothetical protein
MKTTASRSLLLAAVTLLSACGGSTSTSNPTGGGSTGTTANLFLKGAVTAKAAGTMEVNGVALSVPAQVRIEGVERPESELHDGMQVKVKVHADTTGHHGEGLEVEAEHAVMGKVEDKTATTLSVSGQTVRIDDSTHFEDNLARLGSIAAGQRVHISGVPDDRGGLRATRVDKVAGSTDDFELKGVVSGLTTTGFTLKLSPDAGAADTYTVNLLGGATLPAGLANGSFVEVASLKPVQTGQVIEASKITIEDGLPGQAGGETEVEGIVTSGTSASFVLAGTTVTTSATTSWTGGLPGDLLPGVKVEAEGQLGSDGVLAAHHVTFKASVRLQGPVAALSVDGAGVGSFTVNGVTVKIDALTEQRDSVASLAAGDLVEVRGSPGSEVGSVVATRVERSNDDRPIIQGLVTAKDAAAGTLTILGKTISVGSVEVGGLHGHSDLSGSSGPSMTSADFFAAITVGQSVVKARGKDAAAFVDPVLTAKEVELEGDR